MRSYGFRKINLKPSKLIVITNLPSIQVFKDTRPHTQNDQVFSKFCELRVISNDHMLTKFFKASELVSREKNYQNVISNLMEIWRTRVQFARNRAHFTLLN